MPILIPPNLPLAEGGLLDLDLMSSIWVLAIFLVVVIILHRTAWKNVMAGLKAREDRIRKAIADADAARAKAEAQLAEYNKQLATAEQKGRDMISQAGIDAERIATNIKMKAQQELEEAKEKAAKEIEAAKRVALNEIYEQTANLATAVAEKIIRRNLNANDQKDLVSQGLEEFKSVGRN
jgi:F-type H+-transporting ATPase subunit b